MTEPNPSGLWQMLSPPTSPSIFDVVENAKAAITRYRLELLPVCLGCWRRRYSYTADLPRVPGHPDAVCVLCGEKTNHGIRIPRAGLPPR